MMLRVYDHGMGLSEPTDDGDLPWAWQLPTFQRLQQLRLYGSDRVSASASEAYTAVWRWGAGAKFGDDSETFYDTADAADEAESVLLEAIRADLSVADG
jgi:hypothetical protein